MKVTVVEGLVSLTSSLMSSDVAVPAGRTRGRYYEAVSGP